MPVAFGLVWVEKSLAAETPLTQSTKDIVMPKKLDKINKVRGHEIEDGTCRRGHGGRWGRCHGAHHSRRRGLCEFDGAEVPVSCAPAGRTVEVTKVLGDESFRGRIMSLGLVPGVFLRVLSGGSGCPLVIAVSDSRLMLDARSSGSIMVRACEPSCSSKHMDIDSGRSSMKMEEEVVGVGGEQG